MIFSFITNDPDDARAAEAAGIQRIMIDLEKRGKAQRQQGRHLFLSSHRLDDVGLIKSSLQKAALVVRVNPFGPDSEQQIEAVLQQGADYLMLPYFHQLEQVQAFHALVRGRAKTILLFETDVAVNQIDAILAAAPPDECHLGLNDLSICLAKDCFFDLFLDGTVEAIASRLRPYAIPFGLGGVGALSRAGLPISPIHFFAEQIRLGATRAWLGRSFREGLPRQQLATEFLALVKAVERWRAAGTDQLQRHHEAFLAELHAG